MVDFSILIADVPFQISCLFETTKKYCRDYLYDGQAKYSINIDAEDIKLERAKDTLGSTDYYLETLALFRKIAEIMIYENVILFHSSIIEVEGIAYVFAAPSGTGKSTHTALWRKHFLEKEIHMINDDKPFIKIGENIIAYGTPWRGKNNIGENRKAIIKAICFLSQGSENRIVKMKDEQRLLKLLTQTYRSYNKDKMMITIALLKEIEKRVPIYEMECTISYEAVMLAFDTMKNA